MAVPQPRLEYWDKDASTPTWIQAITWSGNNAVLFCTITKALNQPTVAEVILTNRSKDPSSTNISKSTGNLSDPTGEKATLFSDFQDCRIIDNETQQCFFRGRVYHARNQYDLQYGNTVKLILKDMLQELADLPVDDAPPSLRSINLETYDSRSKIIGRLLNGLSVNFASVDESNQTAIDALKFTHSAHVFTANEKRTGDKNPSNEYVWDIVSGKSEALTLVHDFAKQDPHDSPDTKHFGYDYYVDANVNSNVLATYGGDSGKVSFNYFKRGSRPAAAVNTHGLTIEYPSSGWGGQTGFRKSMLTDAEFTNPSGVFFTSIVGHFEDSGRSEGDSGETPVKIHHAVASYELVKGNIPSGHDFAWEGRRLQFILDAPTIEDKNNWGTVPPTGTSNSFLNTSSGNYTLEIGGTNHTILPGQSINPKNPLLLYKTASTTPCATLQYQSGTGTTSFVILGNVNDKAELYTDPQGNTLQFEAFPKTATRLFTTRNLAANNTTAPYIDIEANARARDRHNISKPKRFQVRNLEDYDPIRKEIASILDKSSKEAVTIGKVRVSRYPYTKVIAKKASVSRSTNILTFAAANSLNAFAYADASGTTNDPRDFGAKKGMIIAQLANSDGGNSDVVRTAYITGINDTTITYGASATDTSDGVALDASNSTGKDFAVFVPTEPGHTARFKNNLYGVNYEVLVQKIQYNFSPGILTTTIEGVGLNNNEDGVPGVPSGLVSSQIVGGEEDKGYSINIPPTTQKWQILDGLLTAVGTNKVDLSSINEGRFVTLRTLADGKEYQIDVADDDLAALNGISFPSLEIGAASGDFGHANTAAEEHVIFYRTKGARYNSRKLQAVAVRRTGTATTGGKIWPEIETKHDIVIGRATVNVAGLILAVTEGGAFGTYGQLDVRALGTNRLTNALLKKGAQPFATSIQFLPCQANGSASNATHTNAVYNAFRWTTGNISFGQDATNTVAIADGHQASLSASTSYFAYLTIPTSGGGTISVTDDYRIPFDDDKVLLATVVVSADPSEVGHSPTILPIAGKQLTISAVNMTANAIVADTLAANSITADKIAAGSITANKLESDLVIANNFKTPAGVHSGSGSNQQGIIINPDGIKGYNPAGATVFFLNPATGTVTIGAGEENPATYGGFTPGTGDGDDKTKLDTVSANATAGATWGSNIGSQPSNAQLLNSNLTISIDSNGAFTLGNGGSTTDNRSAEVKRKIFRTTDNAANPPSGPYTVGDWWVTSVLHADVAQRGTNICITTAASGSNDAHWQRTSPPASILTANNVTVDGGTLEAQTVVAASLISNFVLANTVIAGAGTYDVNLNGVAMGLLGNSDALVVQKAGVDQFRVSTSGDVTIMGTVTMGGKATSLVVSDSTLGGTAHQPGAAEDREAGTIGGWKLNSTAIYSSNTAYTGSTYASTGMTLKNTGSIHTPNFYITSSGNIVAQNATIAGTINASSGTFTGNLQSGLEDGGYVITTGTTGLTIASTGAPAGSGTGDTPYSVGTNVNYINFGWHLDDMAVADGNPMISLGSYWRNSSAINGSIHAYEFLWYHTSNTQNGTGATTLQFHNFNRGTLGNITAIGGGSLDSGDSYAPRQFFRPPINASTVSGNKLNYTEKPLLRMKNTAATGYAFDPWHTEWVSIGDIVTAGTNVTITNNEDNVVINATSTGEANADDTAIAKRGQFTGDGFQLTGQSIVTGLTKISHLIIYEWKNIPTDDNGNRRSDQGKVMEAFEASHAFGNITSSLSADSTNRAVLRAKDEKWYGGRCYLNYDRTAGTQNGTFTVYDEGTFYDDSDAYRANLDGATYVWVAYGE